MTKFYLMMIIPNPWLDLDAEPSSSDGDVETCAQAEVSEVANTEPSRVHLAEVACSPSEAISVPESFNHIAEIFAGHAKSDRRFTLNAAKFELDLIDPPPLRNVA